MLTAESSLLAHRLRDLSVIALSVLFLPLTTTILFISYVLRHFQSDIYLRQRTLVRKDPTFKSKTILVTGVGMTKGLTLARLFHRAGHTVIGADFEPGNSLVCGRVSSAIAKFYRLNPPNRLAGSTPYIQGLLAIIKSERVDLWVSCSGVASAVEDGEAMEAVESNTSCKAVQFNARTTQTLHEKHTFIARTIELGLTVPETHEVSSRGEVEDVFARAPSGRKYIMKTIGVDDSVRADMTLLPRPSTKETAAHISRLKISPSTPWIVQQYIDGREFCTHSLVIKGQVRAFVACPSAELLMHYEALPSNSPLSRAMLAFTTTFASKSGETFTGHLSFDFLVELDDLNNPDPNNITLYPIECNPRAHTAVALFNTTPSLTDAYLSLVGSAPRSHPTTTKSPMMPDFNTAGSYYWSGHDLLTKLLLPAWGVLTLQVGIAEFLGELDLLVDHLLTWRDGTWEVWDPLPWWWLYHVYWPLRVWDMAVKGRKWSRVNVSTGKMFEC